jgi:predicted nucleotidyltransferase
MEHFSAFDLQRHIGRVQDAAKNAPVAITHHGNARLVLMDYARWSALGRGDLLADAIKRLQALRELLQHEGISAVSIFGSVARGEARDDSDIDLLIEPAPGIRVGGLKLARWKALLTDLLGRRADPVVREFLDEKVETSLSPDLVEAVFIRPRNAGDAA